MQAEKLQDGAGRTDWVLVFETGDEVMSTLEEFARSHELRAGRFVAIGAFRTATLAYFRPETQEYEEIPVPDQVEVTALVGDVSADGEDPTIHAHCVLGRPDGSTVAGHLMRAAVRPTLELFLSSWDARLDRQPDEASGLALIRLKQERSRHA